MKCDLQGVTQLPENLISQHQQLPKMSKIWVALWVAIKEIEKTNQDSSSHGNLSKLINYGEGMFSLFNNVLTRELTRIQWIVLNLWKHRVMTKAQFYESSSVGMKMLIEEQLDFLMCYE